MTAAQIIPLILYVVLERPELRARIEKRLHDRLREGLVEEVAGLLNSGINRERFALFGMEYKHVARYVNKEVGYDEMASQLLQDIYHLAKRQDTWFRGMERRGLTVHRVPQGDFKTAMNIIRANNLFSPRA
jgi:tRNA dimethylallyltransferase